MVSNYDRIYREIQKYASTVEQNHGLSAEDLTTLILEIVDIEDRNRIKPLHAINQRITTMIDQAAKARERNEEPC